MLLRFLSLLQVQLLIFHNLERKKEMFSSLLVIHFKQATEKNKEYKFGDDFRFSKRRLKCFWHNG